MSVQKRTGSRNPFLSKLKRLIWKCLFIQAPEERGFLYRHLSCFSRQLNNAKVLDVGAGDQRYRELFDQDSDYEACDIPDSFHPDYPPDFVASVYKIPKPEHYYDAVLLLQVLEHLEFPLDGLKEIHRILKPGGYLFLSCPQAAGDHFEPHHYFNYTQFGLKSLLTQAGFEIVEHHRLAGIFYYVGNRVTKMGSIVFNQYRRWIWTKIPAGLFFILCSWMGFVISWFNGLDKKKSYCIGHVVIARALEKSNKRGHE